MSLIQRYRSVLTLCLIPLTGCQEGAPISETLALKTPFSASPVGKFLYRSPENLVPSTDGELTIDELRPEMEWNCPNSAAYRVCKDSKFDSFLCKDQKCTQDVVSRSVQLTWTQTENGYPVFTRSVSIRTTPEFIGCGGPEGDICMGSDRLVWPVHQKGTTPGQNGDYRDYIAEKTEFLFAAGGSAVATTTLFDPKGTPLTSYTNVYSK